MTTQEMRVEFAKIRAEFHKSRWAQFNAVAKHFAYEASDGEITTPEHFVQGAREAVYELKKNPKVWESWK